MTRRTKTIIASLAATLVAAVGVTAPALALAIDAGHGNTTVVTPNSVGDRSMCC